MCGRLHHSGTVHERHQCIFKSMKKGNENFVLTDEGDINKCLVIETTQLGEKRLKISQPFLIDLIISFLNIDKNDYGVKKNTKVNNRWQTSPTQTLVWQAAQIQLELSNSNSKF